MPLPKNYEFSPFVLTSKLDANKSNRKQISYGLQTTDEVHDATGLFKHNRRQGNIRNTYDFQYDRFMAATKDASKSFNYSRPDHLGYEPNQITQLHNEGGDVLEKLDREFDLMDGYNVAGAEALDQSRYGKKK